MFGELTAPNTHTHACSTFQIQYNEKAITAVILPMVKYVRSYYANSTALRIITDGISTLAKLQNE